MLANLPACHPTQRLCPIILPGSHAGSSHSLQLQEGGLPRLENCRRKRLPRHQSAQATSKVHAAGSRESPTSSDENIPLEQHLTADQIHKRLSMAADLIKTAHELAPFDRQTFNAALLIWRAVADVPPAARTHLLRMLTPQDIRQAWVTAGQRYRASREAIALAQGPQYSIWDDFPDKPGQVVTYEGRAAVPLAPLLGGFQKAFFLQPRSLDLFGRVKVKQGPLGDWLYPLYFRASIDTCIVPDSGEPSEAELEYQSPEALGLRATDLPLGWPQPGEQRWPFSGLVDYLRPLGPGVYAGVGWKPGKPGTNDPGRRFLSFVLVKKV